MLSINPDVSSPEPCWCTAVQSDVPAQAISLNQLQDLLWFGFASEKTFQCLEKLQELMIQEAELLKSRVL